MSIEFEEQILTGEMEYLGKLHKIIQETIQEKDLIIVLTIV